MRMNHFMNESWGVVRLTEVTSPTSWILLQVLTHLLWERVK
jgi:hypothetical protein